MTLLLKSTLWNRNRRLGIAHSFRLVINNQQQHHYSNVGGGKGLPSLSRHRAPLSLRHSSRRWASVSVAMSYEEEKISDKDDIDEALIDPASLFNGTIPYPKALSPSSILEFQKCPQSFLFQYLWGLRQPTNLALAKGSMLHSALEQVFDLEPHERTLPILQDLFRKEWAQHRLPSDDNGSSKKKGNDYGNLFDYENQPGVRNIEAEAQWGREGLELLENYVRLEPPESVARPNPVQREVWVRANLTIDPLRGCTAYTVAGHQGDDGRIPSKEETFLVRGIVDRIDMVRSVEKDVVLQIVDYKTGKAPDLKYSPSMNDKIRRESMLQLKIYALLLREQKYKKSNYTSDSGSVAADGLPIRFLRLFHLTSVNGEAETVDFDLGRAAPERDAMLQEVHTELSRVWTGINELVDRQDPHAFVGCDRSFCYCHKCRPRFIPGSVWEPPSGSP